MDDTSELDELYNPLEDNIHRMESSRYHLLPSIFKFLDIMLPRLFSLQLRVLDCREVIRDIHTDVITLEVYSEKVDLSRLFGEHQPTCESFHYEIYAPVYGSWIAGRPE
jgi:hypothetical protein